MTVPSLETPSRPAQGVRDTSGVVLVLSFPKSVVASNQFVIEQGLRGVAEPRSRSTWWL